MPLRFCISLLDVTVPTDTEYRDKSLKSQSYKRDSLTNFLFFSTPAVDFENCRDYNNFKIVEGWKI